MHLSHRHRTGQRSTELRLFPERGDEDDEDEDDGCVDGQSCHLTPAVNHSLLAASPPAATLTHSWRTSPAAAKTEKREKGEKKVTLEISKEEAVQRSGLRWAVLIFHAGSRWRSSSTCRPALSLPEEPSPFLSFAASLFSSLGSCEAELWRPPLPIVSIFRVLLHLWGNVRFSIVQNSILFWRKGVEDLFIVV